MSAFSMSQLNSDSMGCLTEDTAREYRSSAALSKFFRASHMPFTALTGVRTSEPDTFAIVSDIPLSLYILSPKKARYLRANHDCLKSDRSFTEAGVNSSSSGWGSLPARRDPSACSFRPKYHIFLEEQ